MSQITIKLGNSNWETVSSDSSDCESYYKGTCFEIGKLFTRINLERELLGIPDQNTFERLINKANGFYALIHRNGNAIYAAVDRVRSIPLFYGVKGNRFFLSDDAEWVRLQVGDTKMDPIAREEFQLAGYVTGRDTLFSNVKQLQAGEFLVARVNRQQAVVKCHRYYRFLHTEPESYDKAKLEHELDEVMVNAIKRLIDYAGGRQIVVPLSGGYDSRLIVTMLKRLGYGNVFTFTYGVPGNKESRYSKQVAEALGLKWYFVEYTNEMWREIWKTKKRWNYQKWASGWSSTAHMQDWLAVDVLKRKDVIASDCIFVPGHAGDFVAGSHIPSLVFEKKEFSLDDQFNAVFTKHYNLAPKNNLTIRSEGFWKQRVLDVTEINVIKNAVDLANAFEKWDWQERQSKLICNSVRVYDFFGYDWWLPFWDYDFIKFWQYIPLELRKDREWYIHYVKEQFLQYSTVVLNLSNANSSWVRIIARKLFLNKFNLIKNIYYLTHNIVRSKMGPAHLLWRARYPGPEIDILIKKGYKPVGINAYDLLKSIDQKIIKQY